MKEEYPFASFSICARSWAGRALFTLGLGKTQGATLYLGCINACDGETAFALLNVFENMCRAYRDSSKLCGIRLNEILDGRGVVFIPCVNPDGVEICLHGAVAAGCYAGLVHRLSADGFDGWRANAAGVDLNHNLSDDWRSVKELERNIGYTSPGARFYGGKVQMSEPETRGIVRLCRQYDIRHLLTLCRGENGLYSAGGESEEKGALMSKIIRLCSGLEAEEKSTQLSCQRGFADWFSSENGRAAFSLEYADYSAATYKMLEEAAVLTAIM